MSLDYRGICGSKDSIIQYQNKWKGEKCNGTNPNRKLFNRPINLFYPLEINEKESKQQQKRKNERNQLLSELEEHKEEESLFNQIQ